MTVRIKTNEDFLPKSGKKREEEKPRIFFPKAAQKKRNALSAGALGLWEGAIGIILMKIFQRMRIV